MRSPEAELMLRGPAKATPAAGGCACGAPVIEAQFLRKSAYDAQQRATYFADGRNLRSTTVPQTAPVPAIGTWLLDDTFRGQDGHEIMQLVELPIGNIEISEDTGPEKRASLRQYAAWLLEGLQAPPICVLQTDSGALKTLDHRRLLAAKIVGAPAIQAWVIWATHSSRPGNPTVGLTRELALAGKLPLPVRDARAQYTMFRGDRWMVEEIASDLGIGSKASAAGPVVTAPRRRVP